jgi:hypothetical protein
MVVGLAVTRAGVPGRHGVLPGKTVDGATVAHVTADLRGWQLRRGVCGGDAGMVSPEKRTQLSARGGPSSRCLPRRRGDEVTRAVCPRPGRDQRGAANLRGQDVGGARSGATTPRQRHGSAPLARSSGVRSTPPWRPSTR